MRQKGRHTTATINLGTIIAMVARMVAVVWLLPALFVNIDWTQGWYSPWNLGAAGSILASALFMEGSRHARSWILTPMLVLASLFLVYTNVQIAFDNATHKSDDRSDHRKSAIIAAEKASSQRSQWSQSRTEAATVAGERSSEAFNSDIQQVIAKDAKRWAATGQCDPLKITAGQSMAFCADIAGLKAKMAAASQREDLDRKIAELDSKTEGLEVVSTADPFSENIAELMLAFGIRISDDVKAALPAQRNASRALALELVAAFGPTAWLLFVDAMLFGAAAASTATAGMHRRQEKPATAQMQRVQAAPEAQDAPAEADTPALSLDDPFHAFVSESLEEHSGVWMKATEPFTIWVKWCAARGLEPGSQKAFGTKMKTRFAHDQNNNRPRYLNVRPKRAAPKLVIAN